MHYLLEQLKSAMHHAEAFEEETLRRFRLKLNKHGRDVATGNHEYIYSLVDPEGETFGCRVLVDNTGVSFEVFYEDNNESGDRAYSLVAAFHPETHEYDFDIEATEAGRAEILAVMGQEFDLQSGKRPISADQYALVIAGMARRFAENQRAGLS